MQIILSEKEVKTIYDALKVAKILVRKPTEKAPLTQTEVEIKINTLLVRFKPYVEE